MTLCECGKTIFVISPYRIIRERETEYTACSGCGRVFSRNTCVCNSEWKPEWRISPLKYASLQLRKAIEILDHTR